MSYTTESKIENFLMMDIDPSMSSQISDWISAVENYINKYTNRKDGFESATVATIKYFDGNGKIEIDIDSCTEVTSVEVLELTTGAVEWTLVAGMSSDYITYPYNELPIYRLILRPTAQIGAWYKGDKRIKVTAKWGVASSVPKDIELVATKLVASIIEKGANGGSIRSESLGDYSVTFQDLEESAKGMGVNNILDNYRLFIL